MGAQSSRMASQGRPMAAGRRPACGRRADGLHGLPPSIRAKRPGSCGRCKLKTSEIAAYICDKNPRIFIGCPRPYLPLLPILGSRTWQEVGWCAYQLIRMADPEVGRSANCVLMVNLKLVSFACFDPKVFSDNPEWQPVKFDGYGELVTWQEVAG